MHIDLKGKTAVVTASTAGIGLAIAEGLARAGARVVVNGRSDKSVESARAQLRAAVPDADVDGVAADLPMPPAPHASRSTRRTRTSSSTMRASTG